MTHAPHPPAPAPGALASVLAPDPPWGPRWSTSSGITVLLEESHAIPLVDVEVVIHSGALLDPPGKEGLARLAARMLRMGTKRLSAEVIDESIDAMGASLSAEVGHAVTRLHGAVIRRSLPQFLELVGQLVSAPALRATDLGVLQRETIADLASQRDNDRWLANRAFRKHLFGDHAYGRPTFGSEVSIARVKRADVARFVERSVVASNITIGIAGDVSEHDLRPLIEHAFARIPRGAVEPAALAVPESAGGRRVLCVDKPERTQTQVYLGTLGAKIADPLFYPLLVANTAFGGTFTSRLVREVRSERGWSYTAHARLGADREREAWAVYTHPSMEVALECIALELRLIQAFIDEGVSDSELAAARDYLVKSHAFDRDTAGKRLEPRLDAEIQRMPASFYTHFAQHVSAVTREGASAAVGARLSHEDLSIVLVASASQIADGLMKLPGVREVEVVPFDRV